MGCESCKPIDENSEQCLKEIMKQILNGDTSSLKYSIKSYARIKKDASVNILNLRCIIINTYNLNFLSFSLVTGSLKAFKYLYERCCCSLEIMNQIFIEYSIDPLYLLCEKNHLDLLKYYLPLYFRTNNSFLVAEDNTIDFKNSFSMKENKELYTPIQIACVNGLISLVDYLYKFNMTTPYSIFDVKEPNEYSGENCALLSIRSGDIAMVRLMFENYKLDFSIKNRFGEGALQICACCCKNFPQRSYAEVFMYLLDEVRVDITENHEEILLVLENKDLIDHYQRLLHGKGIMTSKKEIDDMFRISRGVNFEVSENKKSFNLKDELSSSSVISSIPLNYDETPFRVESLI